MTSKTKFDMDSFMNRMRNPRERIYLPEILTAVCSEKKKADKVKLLRQYANRNEECTELMYHFSNLTYNESIVFELPVGTPPYKTDFLDYNMAPQSLLRVFRNAGKFIINDEDYVPKQANRENAFIRYLEGMFKPEAELMCMIKDGIIDSKVYPGIDEDLIREAYPNWLPVKSDE